MGLLIGLVVAAIVLGIIAVMISNETHTTEPLRTDPYHRNNMANVHFGAEFVDAS